MAWIIVAFIALCLVWLFRAANKLFGIIKPKDKPFKGVVKRDIPTYKAEEIKPEAAPSVTNIQNNYHNTQIIFIDTK